ncbi:magnetosome protein MamQ, greigite-specific [Candidatus Magnetomorum sp. HK-1]|nr:magnetosome protein MamQ, greigite-specific [Candidatus Magnetomorum sp. HK-1]
MNSQEGISTEELKYFLTRQIKSLLILKKILILIVIIAAMALIGHVIYYFNHLTTLRYDVETAQSQVESALQYRANAIPVLIESVVSFVEHEDNVFNRAVDARERSFAKNEKIKEAIKKATAKGSMEDIFNKIIAIAEQYPSLTSSAPFQQLMKDVSTAELEIYKQRINFNDKVNIYTTAISMFPGNAYAALLFDFPLYEYFKGSKYSEWPHFEGKPHEQWPQVEFQNSDNKSTMRQK